MIFYMEIETKMRNFRKIAIYQIWTHPDWNKKTDHDPNNLKLIFYKKEKRKMQFPNQFTAKQPEIFENSDSF